MGFSSLDAIVNAATVDGKTNAIFWQKASANSGAGAAGRWYELLSSPGVPSAVTFSGSAGVATALNSSTVGAMPLIEGNVSPNTRHMISMSAWSNSTTVAPAQLILCDFLLYYPVNVVTGTPTTLNNSVTLPRYTDGIGVQAICSVSAAGALGAASPALTFTFTATDSAGTTSSQTGILTSPGNSAPTRTCFASNGGVFLPIPNGRVGVRRIDSYTLASGTAGTVNFILVKPLATIPLAATYIASERDLLYQIPALPQIQDGACLGWLVMPGGNMAANSNIMGTIRYAWN